MRSAVIIGCGRMGREHAEAYRELGVPIAAVCDLDFYKAQAFAQEFNSEAHEDSDLFPTGALASICSWDDAHAHQIGLALYAGCKVIAEKPLCLTFDDLKQVMVWDHPRLYCNLPLRFTDHLSEEKPYCVQADYIWGRADQLNGWRKQCPGYSFVLGGGVHVADLICRRGRPMFVTALGHDANGFGAPTMIQVSGEYDDGRTFGMSINCANVGEHTAHLVEWYRRGRREFRTDGADKRATIRAAVLGTPMEDPAGIQAHAVCFAIERSLKNRRVEQVIYP